MSDVLQLTHFSDR